MYAQPFSVAYIAESTHLDTYFGTDPLWAYERSSIEPWCHCIGTYVHDIAVYRPFNASMKVIAGKNVKMKSKAAS